MTAEDRLKAAFAFDEPPAGDLAFVAATMQRVAARLFWMRMLLLAPLTLAAIAVLWASQPALEAIGTHVLAGVQPALSVLAAIAIVLFLLFQTVRRRAA